MKQHNVVIVNELTGTTSIEKLDVLKNGDYRFNDTENKINFIFKETEPSRFEGEGTVGKENVKMGELRIYDLDKDYSSLKQTMKGNSSAHDIADSLIETSSGGKYSNLDELKNACLSKTEYILKNKQTGSVAAKEEYDRIKDDFKSFKDKLDEINESTKSDNNYGKAERVLGEVFTQMSSGRKTSIARYIGIMGETKAPEFAAAKAMYEEKRDTMTYQEKYFEQLLKANNEENASDKVARDTFTPESVGSRVAKGVGKTFAGLFATSIATIINPIVGAVFLLVNLSSVIKTFKGNKKDIEKQRDEFKKKVQTERAELKKILTDRNEKIEELKKAIDSGTKDVNNASVLLASKPYLDAIENKNQGKDSKKYDKVETAMQKSGDAVGNANNILTKLMNTTNLDVAKARLSDMAEKNKNFDRLKKSYENLISKGEKVEERFKNLTDKNQNNDTSKDDDSASNDTSTNDENVNDDSTSTNDKNTTAIEEPTSDDKNGTTEIKEPTNEKGNTADSDNNTANEQNNNIETSSNNNVSKESKEATNSEQSNSKDSKASESSNVDKKYTDLLNEISKLKNDNKTLREENTSLKQENTRLSSDFKELKADMERKIEAFEDKINKLEEQLSQQEKIETNQENNTEIELKNYSTDTNDKFEDVMKGFTSENYIPTRENFNAISRQITENGKYARSPETTAKLVASGNKIGAIFESKDTKCAKFYDTKSDKTTFVYNDGNKVELNGFTTGNDKMWRNTKEFDNFAEKINMNPNEITPEAYNVFTSLELAFGPNNEVLSNNDVQMKDIYSNDNGVQKNVDNFFDSMKKVKLDNIDIIDFLIGIGTVVGKEDYVEAMKDENSIEKDNETEKDPNDAIDNNDIDNEKDKDKYESDSNEKNSSNDDWLENENFDFSPEMNNDNSNENDLDYDELPDCF